MNIWVVYDLEVHRRIVAILITVLSILIRMHADFTLILIPVALCTLAVAIPAIPPNVVDLGYAKYEGSLSFDLRFRAPVSLNTSRVHDETQGQIVNATTYPNFCVQGGGPCEYPLMDWSIYRLSADQWAPKLVVQAGQVQRTA